MIAGGSGNNGRAALGRFLIWFLHVEAEPIVLWIIGLVTSGMVPDNTLRFRLLESAGNQRLMTMGLILLLVLRFKPCTSRFDPSGKSLAVRHRG